MSFRGGGGRRGGIHFSRRSNQGQKGTGSHFGALGRPRSSSRSPRRTSVRYFSFFPDCFSPMQFFFFHGVDFIGILAEEAEAEAGRDRLLRRLPDPAASTTTWADTEEAGVKRLPTASRPLTPSALSVPASVRVKPTPVPNPNREEGKSVNVFFFDFRLWLTLLLIFTGFSTFSKSRLK